MASNTELLVELGVDSSKFSKQITAVTKEVKELDKELKALDTTTDDYNTNMKNMATYTEKCKTKINDLETILDSQNKALTEAKTKFENAKKAQEEYLNGTKKSASETEKHQKAVEQAGAEVQKYTNGIKDTERQIQSATQDLAKMNAEIAKAPYEEASKKMSKWSDGLGKISDVTKPLTLGIAGIATASVAAALSFDDQMTQVQAVSGATATEMEKLKEVAREMGETTEFSATQAGEALYYMSLAGWDTEQSIAGLPAVLDLATAAGMDLGNASDIVTDALTAFGLKAEDASSFCDVLAVASSNSNTTVEMLGSAFKNVAPLAGAMGYSINDVSLALGLMANAGIKSEAAGTQLKTLLANMTDPTEEMATAMGKYNISLTDSEGNMKSLSEVIGDLRTVFANLDETQQAELASTLAGKEGMAGLLAIVNAGEADYNKLTEAINGSEGACADMAETMRGSAANSIESLKSKISETAISIGEKLLPHVLTLVEKLGDLVDWFNNLSDGTQDTIINMGLLVAGISPVTGALSKVTSGFSSLFDLMGKKAGQQALEGVATGLGTVATQAGGAVGAIGTAAGSSGLVASFGALATSVAPFLIGGALIVGLGLGLKKIHDDMVEAGIQSSLLAEGYEGDVARMNNANKLLAEEFDTKYQEVKGTMETFKTEGSTLLSEAFANAQEPTSINLDNFNILVDNKLKETRGIIEENKVQMGTDLALFNTNFANQTILGWDTINAITDGKSKEMEKHVQVAYDNMINIQKQSALIGQEITDEYGNTIVYTSEMYYNDLQKAYDEYCDETLKAQVGFYGDELFAQESFINDSGAKTYQQYQEQLKDAEQQREDLKDVAQKHYEDQITVIGQLSDEEIAKMGFTREQLIEIAQLQREQYYQEAEGMYQDAKEKYTQMAEDTTTITDDQRKNTVENARKAKEETTKEISDAQERINEILREAGYDVDEYGNIIERTSENIKSEFTSAANTAETESARLKRALDQIESKEVDITVNFSQTGYDSLVRKMNHVSTGAGKYGYDPALNDGVVIPRQWGTGLEDVSGAYIPTSAYDLYGLKDTKTISLASFGESEISPVATKDTVASGIVSGAVSNYNNAHTTVIHNAPSNNAPMLDILGGIYELLARMNPELNIYTSNPSDEEIVNAVNRYMHIHGKKRW